MTSNEITNGGTYLGGSMTWAGWANFSQATIDKIQDHETRGFQILVGNDPYLAKRPKWVNHECTRLSQYNHRGCGYSLRTVWAVQKLAPKAVRAGKQAVAEMRQVLGRIS